MKSHIDLLALETMALPLSSRVKDPSFLLSACQHAFPSWSSSTLKTFSFKSMSGGFSSPGLFLVRCSAPGAKPTSAVMKLEAEDSDQLEAQDTPYLHDYFKVSSLLI